MRVLRYAALGLTGAAGVLAVAATSASCSATTTNVPLRTFDRPGQLDVVCLHVVDPTTGIGVPASQIAPLSESDCAPVPTNVDGNTLPNHLYAVVTQQTKGQLAVVDLTGGSVVDEDHSTPGTNFIPVGKNPTDVAVSLDQTQTFVSCNETNKPAIYAIPNTRLLGDWTGGPSTGPLELTDLNACALPQPPQALAVAASSATTQGYVLLVLLSASLGQPAHVIAIDPASVLPNDASTAGSLPACTSPGGGLVGATALSATLPASWSPGPSWADGVPYADAGDLTDALPSSGPSCTTGAAATMGGLEAGVVDSGTPGIADGSGGDDGGDDSGEPGLDAGAADADAGDASDGAGDASVATNEAGAGDAGAGIANGGSLSGFVDGSAPVALGPLQAPHPTAMVFRDDANLLYVSDDAVPVIHVIDVSDPRNLKELPPLLATSVANPLRRVAVTGIALSPPTRDYKRYLYAIDGTDGSLLVYDVTEPTNGPHVPMQRPHAELNPLSPPDRITFPAPVSAISFIQHDWPLLLPSNADPVHAYTGLLCNPNPSAHTDSNTFEDFGAYYRADLVTTINSQTGTVQSLPTRLRGIFGMATLSNGNLVTVDVDDWDAPCRRPDPMTPFAGGTFGMTGELDLPEPPATSAAPLDPYHAPITYNASLGTPADTQEVFFPVSAPNRVRSTFLLRNDPSSGQHMPDLVGAPQLFDVNSAPLSIAATSNALIMPTRLPDGFIDPTYILDSTNPDPNTYLIAQPALESSANQTLDGGAIGAIVPQGQMATAANAPSVRVAFDDPTVARNENWTVTYEGVIPSTNPNNSGVAADISTVDNYQTLTLHTSGFNFCTSGVEDHDIGQARATQALAEMTRLGVPQQLVFTSPPPPDLTQWTGDYVEIVDDLLQSGDKWWSGMDSCWEPSGLQNATPAERYDACNTAFDDFLDDDTHYGRDFPILQAYSDHAVVGRFAFNKNVSELPSNRQISGPDPVNTPIFLSFAQCCFHKQASFKVRTGGEWVTVGTTDLGMLHHVRTDPSTQRCVLSCDPNDALMNARSFEVPWWTDPNGQAGLTVANGPNCIPAPAMTQAGVDRDSPLAMRNPMFSYVMWAGCGPDTTNDHTLTKRDTQWRFTMGGGFQELAVSLTGNTTTTLSPQATRFIDSLGQLAVIDGSSQGLILIDLNQLIFAHAPYF